MRNASRNGDRQAIDHSGGMSLEQLVTAAASVAGTAVSIVGAEQSAAAQKANANSNVAYVDSGTWG